MLVEKYNTTKTVPKIFKGKVLIGGYEELEELVLQQQREKANHGEGGLWYYHFLKKLKWSPKRFCLIAI